MPAVRRLCCYSLLTAHCSLLSSFAFPRRATRYLNPTTAILCPIFGSCRSSTTSSSGPPFLHGTSMMFFLTICALLAPSAVAAAAFPWNGPQATIFAPAADVWSPAPTSGPGYGAMGLFERQAQGEVKGDNTCGYISASSESSVTCPNKSQICATNTFNGVHGCCDPDSLSSSCVIPTSCIPSSLMSASCTNQACSEDRLVTKCTNDAAPYCYEWLFVYARTTMTQHGCGVSEFTSTATRTYGTGVMSIPSEYAAVTVTETVTQTGSTSDPAQNSNSSSKKTNIGAIAGGAVGGVLGLAAIVFGVWFFLRRRKAKAANSKPPPATHHHHSLSQSSQFQPVTEYNPHGFPAAYTDNDNKTWHSPQSTYNSPHSPIPQYPGQIQWGAVEISGTTRVEAPS